MIGHDSAKLEELRQLCGPVVDNQLRAGGEDGLTDATLKRWLTARKGDVKLAAKDLRAHAAWRAAYVPNGRISAVRRIFMAVRLLNFVNIFCCLVGGNRR